MLQSAHKEAIRAALLERLEKDLQVLLQATKTAHEDATHEENKAEDQYDTRGLEASYLAMAQSSRAQELENSIRALRTLPLKAFPPEASIDIGALVELAHEDKNFWFFLHPCGAGIHVNVANRDISVISAQSPLGTELIGKRTGDTFVLRVKKQEKDYEIISVL